MGLQKAEWKGLDWTDLALDRDGRQAFVNLIMKLRVPLNAGNF
jgi:hypothetical protein